MPVPDEGGTRERILQVAELFFAEHGYHGTKLHQIADRVGIQKASLFPYFRSKKDMYLAVLERSLAETEDLIRDSLDAEGTPLDKIRFLVNSYVDTVAAHPERTKILLRQSLGDAPEEQRNSPKRVLDLVAAYIGEAQKAKLVAPIDPTGVVLGVVGMVGFFFTSTPVLSSAWLKDPTSAASIQRVKGLITEMVERCLRLSDTPQAQKGQASSLAHSPAGERNAS
jgi:AcrR family transcriptional regulator